MSQTPVSVLALILLLPACEATAPLHFAAGERADVWAWSPAEAQRVAEAFDELAPVVVAEMPGTDLTRVEIWVREGALELTRGVFEAGSTPGMYLDGRIHLRHYMVSECCGENPWRMVLAHELVHHLLERDPWHRLPLPVEEGLCDAVAERVVDRLGYGEESRALRAARFMNLLLAIGALQFQLRVDGERVRFLSTPTALHAPSGDALVERRGFLGLHTEDPTSEERAVGFVALRRALQLHGWSFVKASVEGADANGADVEPLLFLGAAGLGEDPQAWLAAARELFDPEDLKRSVECFPWLADWLAVEWPAEPGASLAWLADRQLELRWSLDPDETWIDISDCSSFDDELRARDGGMASVELE